VSTLSSPFLEKAEKLSNYFGRLVATGASGWSRQLFLSRLWQAVLVSEVDVSREAFQSLVTSFASDEDLGTAFEELTYWIGRWVQDQ
jgi:hypothetical protein